MMVISMKRFVLQLLLVTLFLGTGLVSLAQEVSAQAVLWASPTPGPVQPSQYVDCPANSISNLSVWIPPNIDRAEPSGIRFAGLSAIFENKRIWLELISTQPGGDFGPQTFRIPISIDAVGNADLTQQTLSQLAPDVPEGTYTIIVRGGPITSRVGDGPFSENWPVCFAGFSAEYVLTVEGGTECKSLGDSCTPGEPLPILCRNATYSYCDGEQNPPRLRLPTLAPVILNGAKCEFVPTPGNVTCAQSRATLPVICGSEILTRLDSSNASSPVQEVTMCCESTLECARAQGQEEPRGETTMVPFNACRQVSIPDGESSGDAQARAAAQLIKRNDCCKCMTGDQSSVFIPGDQRCSGEAESEAAAATSVEAAERRGIYTAIGCVSTSVTSDNGMIAQLVRIGLGLAGGLALLMILAGAFTLSTSQGDPKKANEAKELVTSAVMGIIFIIFSVTLLQFIGVSVLQIPGFGV